MLNRRLIGLLALLLSAGLSLTACSDDDDGGSGDSNNGGGTDAGNDTVDPPEGNNNNNNNNGGEDAGGESDTSEPTEPSGCTSDEQCSDGFECNTTTNKCVALPTGCDQTGDTRPERCDQQPEDITEFGPSSYVTTFKIADEDCCFNLDGNPDGDNTNRLGRLLGLLESQIGDPNESIQDSIDEGSLVLLFEHEGLADLDSGSPYTLNVWLGEKAEPPNPADGFLIDRVSIDDGAAPQASLPNAKIENGVLTAGPGTVNLSIGLPGLLDAPLDLTISMAQIEAQVVTGESSIEDGIVIADQDPALQGGKLGGVIKIQEVVNAVNDFADGCSCLEYADNFIEYDPNAPEEGLACAEDFTNNCTEDDDAICGGLPQACSVLPMVANLLTDVDTTGDGNNDSTSIGITFDTTGTKILGFGD